MGTAVTALIAYGLIFIIFWGRLIWVALKPTQDAPEETQDDFRTSAERWGYLADKRRGK